jgi:hypothetical protein
MKFIIVAPRELRTELVAKLKIDHLTKRAILVFDPLNPRRCDRPASDDWLICVDPEFADLTEDVLHAADTVYRLEGLRQWRAGSFEHVS